MGAFHSITRDRGDSIRAIHLALSADRGPRRVDALIAALKTELGNHNLSECLDAMQRIYDCDDATKHWEVSKRLGDFATDLCDEEMV